MAEEQKLTYLQAMHAMQSGVAYEIARDPESASAKHLRVGLNSAQVNDAALVKLLIAKGVFTLEEYSNQLTEEANLEVQRYEAMLSAKMGANIALG